MALASSDTPGLFANIRSYRRAYVLTVIASFGGMLFGWDTGLIGGVLQMPAFQDSFKIGDSNSKAYANVSGNIVSVLQAGCFFGAGFSFFSSDRFGRRISLLLGDVCFLVGSVIQVCSGLNGPSLGLLYAGRVIGGFGVGMISAVVPMYIGENVNKEIRGRCIGCMQLFNVTGIALSYFVNYGISQNQSYGQLSPTRWRIPFALQMIPGLLLFIGLQFQKESPRWLVEKNHIEQAHHALAYVRAKPVDDETVRRELEDIVADSQSRSRMSMLQQFKAACANKRDFYRFSMAIILMFWQQWTGTNSINYYSPQIFNTVGVAGSSASLFATGIYGVVKIVFTALSLALVVESLGRKYSLIISALGQAFSMYYIGIRTAVAPAMEGEPLTPGATFSIVSVYLFVVFYSFGWGAIPFVLSSECSPNHLRSFIMAASLMTQWLFNFVIAKITPIMLAAIPWGTFLVFGSLSICMCIWVIFCVPETKGVPLERIHLLFEGRIIKGALNDMIPRKARANKLQALETNIASLAIEEESSNGDDDKVVNAAHVEVAPGH